MFTVAIVVVPISQDISRLYPNSQKHVQSDVTRELFSFNWDLHSRIINVNIASVSYRSSSKLWKFTGIMCRFEAYEGWVLYTSSVSYYQNINILCCKNKRWSNKIDVLTDGKRKQKKQIYHYIQMFTIFSNLLI